MSRDHAQDHRSQALAGIGALRHRLADGPRRVDDPLHHAADHARPGGVAEIATMSSRPRPNPKAGRLAASASRRRCWNRSCRPISCAIARRASIHAAAAPPEAAAQKASFDRRRPCRRLFYCVIKATALQFCRSDKSEWHLPQIQHVLILIKTYPTHKNRPAPRSQVSHRRRQHHSRKAWRPWASRSQSFLRLRH